MVVNLDGIGIGLIVLDSIGWIVTLAGLATLTGETSPVYSLNLQWWATWFQFFTLVATLVTAIAATSPGWAQLRRDFLVMVTVLLMVTSHEAVITIHTAEPGGAKSGAETFLGGSIICMILNFALLAYFALEVGSGSPWKPGPSIKAAQPANTASTAAARVSRQEAQSAGTLQFPVQASGMIDGRVVA